MKIFAMLMTICMLSSCAMLDQGAEKIATAVIIYCQESYTFRSIYRNTVNSQLDATGHKVHVHCSGDPADVSGRE